MRWEEVMPLSWAKSRRWSQQVSSSVIMLDWAQTPSWDLRTVISWALDTSYTQMTANDINWTDCFLCTLRDMNKLHCTSWPVSQFSLVASVQCNKISILVQLISVTLYMSLQTAATWYLCSTDGKFCPTYKWHEKASMFRASINDPMSWNSSLSIEINHRAIHFELHWSANLL